MMPKLELKDIYWATFMTAENKYIIINQGLYQFVFKENSTLSRSESENKALSIQFYLYRYWSLDLNPFSCFSRSGLAV